MSVGLSCGHLVRGVCGRCAKQPQTMSHWSAYERLINALAHTEPDQRVEIPQELAEELLHDCGRLNKERHAALAEVERLKEALEKLVACSHDPSEAGCNCYRKANAALKHSRLAMEEAP